MPTSPRKTEPRKQTRHNSPMKTKTAVPGETQNGYLLQSIQFVLNNQYFPATRSAKEVVFPMPAYAQYSIR